MSISPSPSSDGRSGPGSPGDLGPSWQQRYQEGPPRWDLGQPAPALVDWLTAPTVPVPGRVLVPGSGRGHDALLLARHGFEVMAVDFAPEAIAATREQAEAAGLSIQCLQRNIFELTPEYSHQFDYVVEHTCFCAINPDLRPAYVHLMADLLKPGGRLIAIFFTHSRPGGPPFGLSPEAVTPLFSDRFHLLSLEPVKNSVPSRRGEEHFGQLLKQPET
ncbi:SAM-dependent methyltransferase [filamentous cyanobacterium CCP5]|nr:SAM-dependent methyltransferase [filamentous cyanobacterium CCP5]